MWVNVRDGVGAGVERRGGGGEEGAEFDYYYEGQKAAGRKGWVRKKKGLAGRV